MIGIKVLVVLAVTAFYLAVVSRCERSNLLVTDTELCQCFLEEGKRFFIAVPQVLKKGMEIYQHYQHKGRGYDTVTFAAPVTINGITGNMAVVVKKTKGNRYKTHRILMPDGSAFFISRYKKSRGYTRQYDC